MRAVLVLLLCCAAHAQAQTTRALIVTGVGGEPRLSRQFARDGEAVRAALVQRFRASASLLTESSTPRSDRIALIAALRRLANETKPGDDALVVFIGHGSSQGDVARFNIPGPDITASELAVMLEPLLPHPTTVVLATSASGAFLPALKAARRAVITATRSAAENEEVAFARFFADALARDVADADKDGAVSMAEAFEYTKVEVARFYKEESRLATEHAVLSDTTTARAFRLRTGGALAANAELAALQRQIEALKARKAGMNESAYEAELEKLMLELARKTRELRASGRLP